MSKNESMTLELKNNDLLSNVFQYIYKHKHIFNNTQCKIHSRHIIMDMVTLLCIWCIEDNTGLCQKKHMTQ